MSTPPKIPTATPMDEGLVERVGANVGRELQSHGEIAPSSHRRRSHDLDLRQWVDELLVRPLCVQTLKSGPEMPGQDEQHVACFENSGLAHDRNMRAWCEAANLLRVD